MSQAPRTSRQYRALGPDPFLGPVAGGDPLDGIIRTRVAFDATVANAARLNGLDVDHLLTSLRLAGQPGVPVTAKLIYDTAAALRKAGYAIAPPANDIANWPTPRVSRLYSCGSR